MRLACCCLMALVLCAVPAAAGGWDEILAARLDESATYRQARLKLKSAEVAERKYSQAYLPSLSLGTSGQTSLGMKDGEFTGATIAPSLSLSGILGADLAVKAPVIISDQGKASLGDPSLSLTRKLFTETAADRLDAQAALLNAQVALRDATNAVTLQLVTDVLNAVYYQRLLDANRGDLEVLERVRKATTDTASLRELDRRILQARKSILSATSSIAAQDPDIKDRAEELYEEVRTRSAEWTAAVPRAEAESASSDTIDAKELELAAAEKRSAFSLLPFLPNPSFSAEVSYGLEDSELHWGLSMQFSVVLLDKGERALSALQRKENAALARLELESAKESLADNIKNARNSLSSLELDSQIKALDLADQEDVVSTYTALFNGGYTSEEDLVVEQIDLSIAQLEAQKIEHDILIQKMKLAQYFAME